MTSPKKKQTYDTIISSTEQLLNRVGRDSVTIRAIADMAHVQAPTIYRLFGDKVGLLNAVAEEGFIRYMSVELTFDSNLGIVDEFRNGWDIHVAFGVNHPELYKLMFGDAYAGLPTPAAKIAFAGFDEIMTRMETGGYLQVSKEEGLFRAFASASGVVLALLSLPRSVDRQLYAINARENLVASIVKVK